MINYNPNIYIYIYDTTRCIPLVESYSILDCYRSSVIKTKTKLCFSRKQIKPVDHYHTSYNEKLRTEHKKTLW